MKTPRLVVAVLVLNAAVCAGQQPAARVELAGSARVELGEFPGWLDKTFSYELKNTGSAPATIIGVVNTCGCVTTSLDRTEIPAGGAARLTVVIPPNSLSGKFERELVVETSALPARFVSLWFAGNAVPLVKVTPSTAVWAGRIPAGEGWSQTLVLEPSLLGVRLGDPIVEANYPLKTSLQQATQETGVCYKLDIEMAPVRELGELKGTVRIPIIAPTNAEPVRITLAARLGSDLQAVPSMILLPDTDQPQVRSFRLQVPGSNRTLDPKELELPGHDGISFNVQPDRQSGRLLVTATFSGRFINELQASPSKTAILTFKLPGASPAQVVCKSMR